MTNTNYKTTLEIPRDDYGFTCPDCEVRIVVWEADGTIADMTEGNIIQVERWALASGYKFSKREAKALVKAAPRRIW